MLFFFFNGNRWSCWVQPSSQGCIRAVPLSTWPDHFFLFDGINVRLSIAVHVFRHQAMVCLSHELFDRAVFLGTRRGRKRIGESLPECS